MNTTMPVRLLAIDLCRRSTCRTKMAAVLSHHATQAREGRAETEQEVHPMSTEPTFLPFSRSDGTETTNLARAEGIEWYVNGTACLFGRNWSMEITREDADRLREAYPEYLPPHKPAHATTPPAVSNTANDERPWWEGFRVGVLVTTIVWVAVMILASYFIDWPALRRHIFTEPTTFTEPTVPPSLKLTVSEARVACDALDTIFACPPGTTQMTTRVCAPSRPPTAFGDSDGVHR